MGFWVIDGFGRNDEVQCFQLAHISLLCVSADISLVPSVVFASLFRQVSAFCRAATYEPDLPIIAQLFVANASISSVCVDLFRFRLDFINADARITSGIRCAWMRILTGVAGAAAVAVSRGSGHVSYTFPGVTSKTCVRLPGKGEEGEQLQQLRHATPVVATALAARPGFERPYISVSVSEDAVGSEADPAKPVAIFFLAPAFPACTCKRAARLPTAPTNVCS